MKPLRIAIDGRPALWPRCGVGNVVHNVLKHFHAAAPDAHVLAYFDAQPGDHLSAYDSVEQIFGGPRQELIWSNTWLPRRLAQDDVDVYLTFLDREVPLMHTRAQVVCMVHDVLPLRFPDAVFSHAPDRIYFERAIRSAVRRADLVLANSRFAKSEIVSALEVDEAKVCVVPLGVEPPESITAEEQEHTLARLGLTQPFVLSIGSNDPRTNLRRVLEAMHLLAPVHPRLSLAVANAPRQSLEFAPSSLRDRVHALGQVSEADLAVLMSRAELLVYPSLHEDFELLLLQAMAHGTPIVTSDLAAIPELAADAALYIDPENPADVAAQMHALLSDPQLRMELHRAGLARAASFRWSSTCSTIAQACGELMMRSHPSREAIAS